MGKYEDAAELWSRLMQLRPKFDGAYIGAVTPFLEQGRFDAALASARKAIELSPGKREAVFKYGLCEYYRGSYLPAVDVLANYLAKDPEYPPVLALLALLYLIQGRRAEGVDLVSKIIRLGFNFAEYVNQEAKKLMSRGRAQDACVLLKALMDERFASPDIQELYAESCAKRQMHTGGPE